MTKSAVITRLVALQTLPWCVQCQKNVVLLSNQRVTQPHKHFT